MKSLKKYSFNIILIACVSWFSIRVALYGNFNEIQSMLSDIPLISIFILISLGFAPHLIETIILKKFATLYLPSYSFKKALINAFTGVFFSGITPFSSGGQFAQAYVFKKQGINYSDSTGLLLLHFILYQICLVGYTFIIMVFKFKEFSSYYHGFLSLALLGFLINTCVILGLLLGALSFKFHYFLTNTLLKVVYKFKLVKDYELSKVKLEKYLSDFHEGLKVISQHPKRMLLIMLLFILKLTVLYSLPFFVLYITQSNVSFNLFFNCFTLCAFVYLITAFVPIPGASGGTEGTYVILFSLIVSELIARFSMIIWRFITYYFTIFIGCIIFMVYINRSKKGEN